MAEMPSPNSVVGLPQTLTAEGASRLSLATGASWPFSGTWPSAGLSISHGSRRDRTSRGDMDTDKGRPVAAGQTCPP